MNEELLRANERRIKARFYLWVLQNLGDNWSGAAKQLEAVTKIKFRPETLRQNIKPSNRKAGKSAHEFRDIRQLKALCDFLLKKRYLYASELTDPANDSFAVNAVRYLVTGRLSLPSMKPFSRFRGMYSGSRDLGEMIETITLYIDYDGNEKPVMVSECCELTSSHAEEEFDRTFSDGWAIWNGERFHTYLVRNGLDAQSYQVVQTYPGDGKKERVTDLAVLRYQDAWVGDLVKTETEISEGIVRTDYQLGHPLDELCFFLTRVSEGSTENTETADG